MTSLTRSPPPSPPPGGRSGRRVRGSPPVVKLTTTPAVAADISSPAPSGSGMPSAAWRPCRYPGCPGLAQAPARGCVTHAALYTERARKARVDATKGWTRQWYGQWNTAWRQLRAVMLAAQPVCACGARSTEVDHVESIRTRPDRALDPTNLVARCKSCHSRRTAREQGFARGGGGAIAAAMTGYSRPRRTLSRLQPTNRGVDG